MNQEAFKKILKDKMKIKNEKNDITDNFDRNRTISDVQEQSGTEAGTEAGAETGTKTGTETGTKTGTETGTKTGTETGTETGTKTGTETGTEAGNEEIKENSMFEKLKRFKEQQKNKQITSENISNNIQDTATIEKPKRKRRTKKVIEQPDNEMLSGFMLLILIDITFPNVITFLHNRTKKGKILNISSEQLKLSAKEQKELLPLAEEAAKSLNTKLSPVTALLIGLGSIYFGNYQNAVYKEKLKNEKR